MIRRATLFFEPLDVLQFRDHRPFDAGYQVNAESTFPMPSVFLGCLRTALLRARGVRFGGRDFGLTGAWAGLLGSPTEQGTLKLRGPLLARVDKGRVEPLFQAPLDLVTTKVDDDTEELRVLQPRKLATRRLHGAEGALSEGDIPWTGAHVGKTDDRRLLSFAGAERYLRTAPGARLDFDDGEQVGARGVYQHEDRVGIARDDTTLTADDRMFYVTRPLRLAPGAGFAVDVELPEGETGDAIRKLDGAVVPLGGKTHRAVIRCFDAPLIPESLAAADAPQARKLWLVTPLVLGGAGWPAGITCAATDRAVPIGGFDMAQRAPKPLRRALPAGTVLTLDGIAPEAALAALGGAGWENDRRAGYGVALAGGVENP